MKTNREDNTLLIRALEKGQLEKNRIETPVCDLSQRIMERIELRAAQKARRERALLLAGAILGGVVILTSGIWITSLLVDVKNFASLDAIFTGLNANLSEIFTPAAITTPETKFLTGLYTYTAVVFLLLSLLGEWLRRKYWKSEF